MRLKTSLFQGAVPRTEKKKNKKRETNKFLSQLKGLV
jgi:hypothetical protein